MEKLYTWAKKNENFKFANKKNIQQFFLCQKQMMRYMFYILEMCVNITSGLTCENTGK